MEVKEVVSRDFQARVGSCLLMPHSFVIMSDFAGKAWVGGRKERKRGGQGSKGKNGGGEGAKGQQEGGVMSTGWGGWLKRKRKVAGGLLKEEG